MNVDDLSKRAYETSMLGLQRNSHLSGRLASYREMVNFDKRYIEWTSLIFTKSIYAELCIGAQCIGETHQEVDSHGCTHQVAVHPGRSTANTKPGSDCFWGHWLVIPAEATIHQSGQFTSLILCVGYI
jgi:hypothetical protein